LRSALLLIAFASGQVGAQVTSGTIVGAAADPTGAVVPNAAVTAVHLGTKDIRRTRTNERGEFSIPFVRIGEHSVSVEKQGFRTQTQNGIAVQVDQTVRIEFALQVVALTERIEVTSAAPLIDASTSSLGQVIGNKKILDLPLNGRNAFALGLLAEGLDRQPMPPTQIARALGELRIVWIPAHSAQAKGRIERQFLTAQDRLGKACACLECEHRRRPMR